MSRKIKIDVLALQKNFLVGDIFSNTENIIDKIEKSCGLIDLVVTSEMALCGYPPKDLLLRTSFLHNCHNQLQKINDFYRKSFAQGRILPCSLVGAPEWIEKDGRCFLYNSAFFFCEDGLKKTIRKTCLPTYDVFDEKRYFSAATQKDLENEGHFIEIPLSSQHLSKKKIIQQAEHNEINTIKIFVCICEDMWASSMKSLSADDVMDDGFVSKNFLQGNSYLLDPLQFSFCAQKSDLSSFVPPAMIVNLCASPFSREKSKQRQFVAKKALQHCDQSTFLLSVNQVGANDEMVFDGGSFLAQGDKNSFALLHHMDFFSEEDGVFSFFVAKDWMEESDKNKFILSERRQNISLEGWKYEKWGKSLLNEKNSSNFIVGGGEIEQKNIFEKFEQMLKNHPKTEEIFLIKALMLGIFDYVTKNGFSSVLVGLSGGIDSAVTATLAALALGGKNVFTVGMPSEYSSLGSVQDSQRLAENLGCFYEIFPIKNIMENLQEQWVIKNECGKKRDPLSGLAEENMQARIRGTLLMGLANQNGRLLLATGNKSELSVGYCTLYGDTNGALAVLGDCFKTEVYEVALAINNIFGGLILKEIIDKVPSAELRADQRDSDSLPDYDVLDGILRLAMVKELGAEEIKSFGFKDEMVDFVLNLVAKNEYKRHQLPPVIRISERAIGVGRRYPIAKSFLGY